MFEGLRRQTAQTSPEAQRDMKKAPHNGAFFSTESIMWTC
jgi:hypothetical protein